MSLPATSYVLAADPGPAQGGFCKELQKREIARHTEKHVQNTFCRQEFAFLYIFQAFFFLDLLHFWRMPTDFASLKRPSGLPYDSLTMYRVVWPVVNDFKRHCA